MNTQKTVLKKIAQLSKIQEVELSSKEELASEKVELAESPEKLIQDFKDQSQKLVKADTGLREAQTIAINVRNALEKIYSDMDLTIKQIDSVLNSDAAKIISNSALSDLKKQKDSLSTARSQAGGRLSRAKDINDAVKKVLNR